MPAIFLTVFGFRSTDELAKPVFLYAGYDPQGQFDAIKSASAGGGFDHFLTNNSTGSTVVGTYNGQPTPAVIVEPSEEEIATAKAEADAKADSQTPPVSKPRKNH